MYCVFILVLETNIVYIKPSDLHYLWLSPMKDLCIVNKVHSTVFCFVVLQWTMKGDKKR